MTITLMPDRAGAHRLRALETIEGILYCPRLGVGPSIPYKGYSTPRITHSSHNVLCVIMFYAQAHSSR